MQLSTHGASLTEFAIVLPILLVVISGVVDYGLSLQRLAVISTAAREGARAAAAYSLEDGDSGKPGFPERFCPGTFRPPDQKYCNLNSPAYANCESRPNTLECLAQNTAENFLSSAGLHVDDWEVSTETCIAAEPPPSAGEVPDPPGSFKAVRVSIHRRPGIKPCIICYLTPLGIDVESVSTLHKLEGDCRKG